MKTVVYFLFTCFISTGAFLAALGSKTPLLLYAVGFGTWALFLWTYSKRTKRASERRSQERLFEDYMRSKISNDRRR